MIHTMIRSSFFQHLATRKIADSEHSERDREIGGGTFAEPVHRDATA